MNFTPEFQSEIDSWRNTDEYNNALHQEFARHVFDTPHLLSHRQWVKDNQFGFGDDPFHWLWKLLVDQMPDDFSFLEIGVFKGQVLSLIALLAKVGNKHASNFGVTTLQNTPDERCKYPEGNYSNWIKEIHDRFEVPMPHLIVGKSTDPAVVQEARLKTYNMVYIDGGHDYRDVVSDITNYAPLVCLGGLLIMDDCSIGRLNVGSCWPGLEAVALAVATHLDKDDRFKFLMAVGHLNVFWRVK